MLKGVKTKKVKKQTILIVEDDVKSFIKQYSIQKRRRILYKIIY